MRWTSVSLRGSRDGLGGSHYPTESDRRPSHPDVQVEEASLRAEQHAEDRRLSHAWTVLLRSASVLWNSSSSFGRLPSRQPLPSHFDCSSWEICSSRLPRELHSYRNPIGEMRSE